MVNKTVSTISAKTLVTAGLVLASALASAYPSIYGPSRQNSNRTATYRVADTGMPTSDVQHVTVYLADNPYWNGKGTVLSVRVNKPASGWSAPVQWTWALPGADWNRTFAAKMVYRHSSGWDETLYAPNLLVYTAGRAGNLNSVQLNTYSVRGGANGSDPTMYVYLDGPAQVGGQWVDVQVNDKHAWCLNGFQGFWIPEGSTYGSVSWFLGTKNVLFDQMTNINAYVNGVHGLAALRIRK